MQKHSGITTAENPEPLAPGGTTPRPAGARPVILAVKGLSHEFPAPRRESAVKVLDDITLEIAEGSFVSIVGPSGCGKSTMLRFISGLSAPTAGRVEICGDRVSGVRRDVGFIFQQDALLPWRTIGQNVQLGLKFRRVPRAAARDQAADWLTRFGLAGKGQMYPHQLSGGQRKRTSIAATLSYQPRLLLMDEPFSSLDIQTRDLIESDILQAWSESAERQTIVLVTHDLEEAIALSDRVVVMSRGPGRVIADYKISLPRPRDIFEVRAEAEFREYYQLIWENLRAEVKGAAAAPGSAN
jgi:NitT/TauT family transport system ATP-binding protein